MKLSNLFILPLFATTALSAPAFNVSITYDQTYDNKAGSLSTVACSNGKNGLLTRGFTTFGSLPSFPNIGGGFPVTGWNSTACGGCWNIAFNESSINVILVDTANPGFNLALGAMMKLTKQAVQLGRINGIATPIDGPHCGLK
ncbi:Cerato-platanin [Rickenella mellea]|uniref:Cerato-platanin n=1 Tax=Rickenella mellea TaxID=50990 RepID=A0A4Y7Q6M4_9AGAM|nr:Cerato-platanin [Rickenella mellea]